MYIFRLAFWFLVFGCLLPKAAAQQYRLYARRYSIEDGMPHRQVNQILQDRRGFIWAATYGGVVRFDGQRFKTFNRADHGLSGDIVDWIVEDAAGYIWVFRRGVNPWLEIIDPISGKVIPSEVFFKNHPFPVSLKRLELQPLKQEDGTLFIGVNHPGGWLTYHPERGWTTHTVPNCDVFHLTKLTEKQTIWGFFSNLADHQVGIVEMGARDSLLYRMYQTPDCAIWPVVGLQGKPNSLFYLEGCSKAFTCWELQSNGVREERHYWDDTKFFQQWTILENGEINVMFPKVFDKNWRCLLDLSQQFPEIDGSQYLDYLLDKNGQIWFATTFGLIVVDYHKDLFQRLLYDKNAPGGRGYACRGLLEQNGQLTVNVETRNQGRFWVSLQSGAVQQIEGDNGIGIAKSLDGNIWSEFCDSRSRWNTSSLMKTTPQGKAIGPSLFQQKEHGAIWTILEDNPARVFLGHTSGGTVFNPQTGEAYPFPIDPNYPEFSGAIFSWINKDKKGRIWACTDQGLYQFKSDCRVTARYWSGGKGAFYFPYDNILHFFEDSEGVFWIGTSGSGLIRWSGPDAPDSEVVLIGRKNGLLNGVVYGVYEDQHQHLWMSTDYGIVQFDKKTLQVRRTWLENDGVTNNEFNRVSHCQGADGLLYFGGLNGVTAFNPNDFYTSSHQDKRGKSLLVSDYKVLDEDSNQLENRTAELLQTSQINLYPSNRYVQLEFALLDFIDPEKVTYTWKIEGISKDWEPLNEPVLRLSSLPYGTYALHIRAQAPDGIMAQNELVFRLKVWAPFYLRWWFILSGVIALALIIWAWLNWRIRTHRQEQERLEKEVQRQTATILIQTEKLQRLDEAKSRFFANISHELRTPLTLLLGPLGSILKRNRLENPDYNFAKTAHQHGRQLLQLVNEILDLSKMEAGKMTLSETAFLLHPLLHRVTSAFESHAERLGIMFVFEYRISERIRILADADKLQKILNNLLSNALKFTPAHSGGSVFVRVEMRQNQIYLEVKDSGRGIHPADLPHIFERFYQTSQHNAPIEGGTGIGLALSKEFTELMQGRIWVESTLGEGSCFCLMLPFKEVLGVGEPEAIVEPLEQIPTRGANLEDKLPRPPQANLRVLLVEDNHSMRDYISTILGQHYQLMTAENGRIALDILAENAEKLPHLIISDIMMPVMDGFQLLETLKGDDRWRHLPVVMLTARADLDDKLRALRIGVDDYLSKPFEEDELLARVENLLLHFQNRGSLSEHTEPDAEPLILTITQEDQRWLEDFEKIVAQQLGNFNLTAEILAEGMAMSRAPFFRQLKRLTGLTPAQYLDEARFQKARRMFERREATSVKLVAYTVGFKQVKHFSQNYKKRFGKLPSEQME